MTDTILPDSVPEAVPRAATVVSTAAAEWLKLRSLRSTWWFVGSAVAIVLVVALGGSNDGASGTLQSLGAPIAAIQYFVQYIAAAMGMLVATGEFGTRSITVTCACTPSRTRVIVAKALVVAAAALALGFVVGGLGTLVAAARLGAIGGLGSDHLTRIVAMSVFLALLAVVGLGIGAVVRRTAGAFTVVLVLLLLVPDLLGLFAERFDAPFLEALADWTPGPLGGRLISGEWGQGFALGIWALIAIAGSVLVLRTRDV